MNMQSDVVVSPAQTNNRNYYFDLLKYLLFICVVLIHNPLPDCLFGGAWSAISRSAVPVYLAISGYFNKSMGARHLDRGRHFLYLYFLFNLIWFAIFTLFSKGSYPEMAKWAKLDISFKTVFNCIVFGSAFGSEYLWYLHAIGMVYLAGYLIDKLNLNRLAIQIVPILLTLYWIMSEGLMIVVGRGVQVYFYRNWLIEGLGFFYLGKYLSSNRPKFQRPIITILLGIGCLITVLEFYCFGRYEFYFGNFFLVYGLLALGSYVKVEDNYFSKMGREHSLHLYLYSPFIAFLVMFVQMVLFHSVVQQTVTTVLVIVITTITVSRNWFNSINKAF